MGTYRALSQTVGQDTLQTARRLTKLSVLRGSLPVTVTDLPSTPADRPSRGQISPLTLIASRPMIRRQCPLWLGMILLALGPFSLAWGEPPVEPMFESHIRPLLKAHCWHCHGEAGETKGGLDLRQVRRMVQGGDSGPALLRDQPLNSPLWQRVVSGEMPPGNKKLSTVEMGVLKGWLERGAPISRAEPENPEASSPFTEEELAFWSFQAVVRPVLPVTRQDGLENEVDRFIAAGLEQQGLRLSPPADRVTLIRRLTLDLWGLPPTPDQIDEFVSDASPEAYSRLVERLLASPRYGERWGRHWLDVAGYADSDGYSTRDLERKYAWKYRDYVVASLNQDLPWNEFLVEQIAGDELLAPPYRNLSPEQAARLIATGFLRMGPDGTGDGEAEVQTARQEVIAETIKIVSTAVLGLTVGCSQCHDHRYDPIPQADYYRMRAIFEPAFDVSHWRNPTARLVSLWHDEHFAKAAEIDQKKQALNDERTKILDGIVSEVFERELLKVPEERRADARAAKGAAADQRTPGQQLLLKEFPALNVDRGSVYLYEPQKINEHNKKYDDLTAQLNSQRPPEDFAHCLTEVPGAVPATRIFARGDFNQPREEVAPAELSILCSGSQVPISSKDSSLPTSGRRLAWARHLTSGRHPLVARVLVNRVWLHHFGAGIVTTPGDFGALGARPTHPELLDWLANRFVESGWSLKSLHRLLVHSATYRQSSQRTPELERVDPENRLWARAAIRRLEAEVVRDSLLAISGQLSNRMAGVPVPVAPDEVGQIVVAVDTRDSAGRPTGKTVSLGEDEFRRSLYVQVRRSMPLSFLESFDVPDMRPNCTLRNSSTVAPQALLMMNSDFVSQRAADLARRVMVMAGSSRAEQVRLVWRLATGLTPSELQLIEAWEFLDAQTAAFAALQLEGEKPEQRPDPALSALTSYCQAILCSNRVLYVE